MRAVIVSLLLALSGSFSAQRSGVPAATDSQRSGTPPAAQGLIVGQVIDATTGRPIPGAIVSVIGAAAGPMPEGRSAGSPRVISTSGGRFLFRDLPRGTFTVSAAKAGYVDGASGRRRPGGQSQSITLGDEERIADLVIRMWKYAAIAGTIVDEMGEPVVGVQVRAFRREFAGGRPRFITDATRVQPSAVTDDRGMYRLGTLVPGDYLVATGGRPVVMSVSMAREFQGRAGNADLGAVALPGTSSSIQVGDVAYGLGQGAPIPAPARDGRLFVYPQTYYPSVSTFPQATVVSVATGEERTAIDLQIHPLPTVRAGGIVVGPDGPAAALSLRMFPAAAEDVELDIDVPTAVTDRNGNFEFPAVSAGQYVIRASIRPPPDPRTTAPSALWLEAPIAVGRSDMDGIVLTLQRGLRVSGHLEFEGNAPRPSASWLQQVPVLLEAARFTADASAQVTGPVDASGQFTVVGAKPGRYLLRMGGSPQGWMFKSATWRGRDVSDESFELDSDASDVVITFTERTTGVRGIVQGVRGPDPDASVLIFPTEQQAWTNYGLNARRIRSARTSRSGDYSVDSIPAGDYYVVAVPDDRAADWQDPAFLASLTPVATRITVNDGDQKLVGLRTREVK